MPHKVQAQKKLQPLVEATYIDKLPVVLQWTKHYSQIVRGGGGDNPAMVSIDSRLSDGRLEIDLNDGRVATVYLSADQLVNLGRGAIAAGFHVHSNRMMAVQKALDKATKAKKRGKKRRG